MDGQSCGHLEKWEYMSESMLSLVRTPVTSYHLQASNVTVQVAYQRAGTLCNEAAQKPDGGFRET